ncbi:hypothetical protein, partial [Pseudomonas sp. PB120]|uniref:hypothetical protein n=1 Tax=Pseudomonas sp. PB120 TaxID=2494700 RepID=UPI001C4986AB
IKIKSGKRATARLVEWLKAVVCSICFALRSSVGASLLAKNVHTTRSSRQPALSFRRRRPASNPIFLAIKSRSKKSHLSVAFLLSDLADQS